MNSAAFYIHKKKRKKNPQVIFELKNEDTLVIRLKRIYNDTTFNRYKKVGRWQYEIKVADLQDVVDTCDKLGWEVVEFPEQVQQALDLKNEQPFDESFKETTLWKVMFPYQREGVEQVVKKYNGRALIGDEMGLGKTLQAISVYKYYNHKKLLIVCPAYLRYTWKNELEKWIPGTACTVICTGKDAIDTGVYPLIMSYELAAKCAKELKKLKLEMVVCDESHYLKSHKTKRTKALTPLVRSIKHALLLSGTPCLNRPVELYSQGHMLQKQFFPKFRQYADRYCNGNMSPMGFYDASGISCSYELKWLIRKVMLIRRVKRDVLTQLPEKNRSEIYLQLSKKEMKPMKKGFERWDELNRTIPAMVPCSDKIKKAAFERKCIVSDLFRKTSVAKANVVKKVVKEMVEQGLKFIVFCYHKQLMTEVESVCTSYMRIDGDTPAIKREQYVKDFQEGDTQVAVLSMLAASTGLTLTATSIVLFAELYYVPGTILQAEDRVHRIGQKNSCDIRFIIARGSIDEKIWKMLHFKLATLDTALDGRSDRTIAGEKIEWGGLDESI